MPVSNVPPVAAFFVELHQARGIFGRDRAAVSLPRELPDDFRRARRLFVGSNRAAGEHSAANGRVRHAGDGVRPDDRQIPQVRKRRHTNRCADVRIGERVFDRRQQVVNRTVRSLR